MRVLDETGWEPQGRRPWQFSLFLQSQSGLDGKASLTLRGRSWGFEFEPDQRQILYAEHVPLAATAST